jgi:hypothetical protein
MMTQRSRFLAAAVVAVTASTLLSACESTGPTYEWGEFPALQYQTLNRDDTDVVQQLADMQEQAEQARSNGLDLPPGFRAHKGLLYLKTREVNKAWAMFNAEKAAFPESAPYIDRLIRRFNGSRRSANPPVNAS